MRAPSHQLWQLTKSAMTGKLRDCVVQMQWLEAGSLILALRRAKPLSEFWRRCHDSQLKYTFHVGSLSQSQEFMAILISPLNKSSRVYCTIVQLPPRDVSAGLAPCEALEQKKSCVCMEINVVFPKIRAIIRSEAKVATCCRWVDCRGVRLPKGRWVLWGHCKKQTQLC